MNIIDICWKYWSGSCRVCWTCSAGSVWEVQKCRANALESISNDYYDIYTLHWLLSISHFRNWTSNEIGPHPCKLHANSLQPVLHVHCIKAGVSSSCSTFWHPIHQEVLYMWLYSHLQSCQPSIFFSIVYEICLLYGKRLKLYRKHLKKHAYHFLHICYNCRGPYNC